MIGACEPEISARTLRASRPDLLELLRKPSRLRVGMDVDGTIAGTHDAMLEEFNLLTASSFIMEDYDAWNVSKSSLRMPLETFYAIYERLWLSEWYKIPPTARTELMGRLADTFDICLSTHRPEGHRASLSDWFIGNYGFEPKIDIVNSSAEKLQRGYHVIFEDAPPFVMEHAKTEGRDRPLVFLVDAPWNRGVDCREFENVIRVRDIDAGITALLRIQKEASRQKART